MQFVFEVVGPRNHYYKTIEKAKRYIFSLRIRISHFHSRQGELLPGVKLLWALAETRSRGTRTWLQTALPKPTGARVESRPCILRSKRSVLKLCVTIIFEFGVSPIATVWQYVLRTLSAYFITSDTTRPPRAFRMVTSQTSGVHPWKNPPELWKSKVQKLK